MNIFCITSTINVSNAPWSYINVRSIWTSEERLEQTIKQINSIRRYCDKSFIILSEGSKLTDEQQSKIIPLVDVFLNDISDPKIYDAIHNSNAKGLGEIYELIAGIKYVKEKKLTYIRFFKFGGRFSLNENFNINNYALDKMSFNVLYENNAYKTILYSITPNTIEYFNEKLFDIINDIPSLIGIEYIYPKYFKEIQYVPILGTEGWMGINKVYQII